VHLVHYFDNSCDESKSLLYHIGKDRKGESFSAKRTDAGARFLKVQTWSANITRDLVESPIQLSVSRVTLANIARWTCLLKWTLRNVRSVELWTERDSGYKRYDCLIILLLFSLNFFNLAKCLTKMYVPRVIRWELSARELFAATPSVLYTRFPCIPYHLPSVSIPVRSKSVTDYKTLRSFKTLGVHFRTLERLPCNSTKLSRSLCEGGHEMRRCRVTLSRTRECESRGNIV